ncbi:hypothetical protein Y1Q_0002815 [Alligator mississippiensis]|uniref:Uncharacterized protein n=1 Tax=Alligator mississippiensis TaxID=8496 RepID=A0A151NZI8_ALLMI|nr:hypothetical protein Y1Q_0002815 [Alligator mississippiensis]
MCFILLQKAMELYILNALSLSPGIEHVSVLITKNDPNSEVNWTVSTAFNGSKNGLTSACHFGPRLTQQSQWMHLQKTLHRHSDELLQHSSSLQQHKIIRHKPGCWSYCAVESEMTCVAPRLHSNSSYCVVM